MNNAEKFEETFGIYATELWAKPEGEFLEWLNAECDDQWIPCEERLPSEDGDYLVTFSLMGVNFPIEVCAYEDGKWDKYLYDGVLAWMPLPKAYEGRTE